jgi:phage baseplate assembly protein W
MDTLLVSGDHGVDGRGIPIRLEGARELIQQALIRLSVPKGGLNRAPDFGSELKLLASCPASARDRAAMSYVQEALAPIRAIRVEAVACRPAGTDALRVETTLVVDGRQLTLEVDVI